MNVAVTRLLDGEAPQELEITWAVLYPGRPATLWGPTDPPELEMVEARVRFEGTDRWAYLTLPAAERLAGDTLPDMTREALRRAPWVGRAC